MNDSERLEYLIKTEAYVEQTMLGWVVTRHIYDDEFETLSSCEKSPREAIDAAMAKTTA